MVLVNLKKLLDRVFPWLLILVVLVSCLPVLPVAAASSYDVVGEWIFDEELSVPSFSSLATQIGDDISFEANDVTYVDIVYSAGFLSYELENGNLVNVYDYNTGWMYDTARTVFFHTATSDFDDAAYSWFSMNALQLADDSSNEYMFTTIVIGDQTFDFSAPIDAPAVTMSITSQAATFTYGFRSFTWLNDNTTQTFLGFGMEEDDTEPVFSVGDTIALPTSPASNMLYTFYPLYSDSGTDVNTATFTIGSNTYVFEGTASSLPEVTMDVTSSGVTLRSGSTSYFHELSSFVGIKLSSTADNYIGVGESFVFPADYSTSSYSQELYPFYSSGAVFTTTVNLYLDDGTIWDTYVFQNTAISPNVTLSLAADSLIIESGGQSFSKGFYGGTLLGLSKVPGSTVISYIIGYDYTLAGAYGENVVYDLSVVLTTSGDPSYDGFVGTQASAVFEGFTNFLIKPVSAFFAIEFIPGFSFGKMALVAFLLGLLFWILRVSK